MVLPPAVELVLEHRTALFFTEGWTDAQTDVESAPT